MPVSVSGSLGAFVAARSLQGIGGAMMTPLARLLLVRATPRNDLVGAFCLGRTNGYDRAKVLDLGPNHRRQNDRI